MQQSLASNYTSFGSFVPLYVEPLQKLLKSRDRVNLNVLLAVALHADGTGLCYPGVDRLADIAGYAPETVKKALVRLFEQGHLRGHHSETATGRLSFDFQVSPYVMWIAPDRIERALTLWEAANIRDYESYLQTLAENKAKKEKKTPPVIKSERNVGQPTTEPALKNQHQITSNKEPTPTTKTLPENEVNERGLPVTQEDAEKLAEQIAFEHGSTVKQMIGLIQQFGYNRVKTTIQYTAEEFRSGRANSPVGLMISMLRRNHLPPNDRDKRQYQAMKWGF
jgi:hypothetical protein